MKSFNLSKEMRVEVARQLTTAAIQKTAASLHSHLVTLNDAFWAQHRANVEQVSGVPQARWAGLIQAGVMTSTVVAEISFEDAKGRSVSCEMISLNSTQADRLGTLINTQKLPPITGFIQASRYSYHRHALILKTENSVPRLNGFTNIKLDGDFAIQIKQVREQYKNMIEAAFTFNDNVMDVLNSCRTSRQLENLFPEAAKLLPQPVQKTSELAPVELVADVQKMLKTGIPNETKRKRA
jgi:hypothetical protein